MEDLRIRGLRAEIEDSLPAVQSGLLLVQKQVHELVMLTGD